MNTNTAIDANITRIIKEIRETNSNGKVPFCPLKVECDTISNPAGSSKFPCKNCPEIGRMANEIYARNLEIQQEIAKDIASEQMDLSHFNRAQVLGILKEKALNAGWCDPIDEIALEKFKTLYKQVFESPKKEYSAEEVRFLINFDPRTTSMAAVKDVVPDTIEEPTLVEKLTNKIKQTGESISNTLPTIF